MADRRPTTGRRETFPSLPQITKARLLTNVELAIGSVENARSDEGNDCEVDEVEAEKVEFLLNPLCHSGGSIVERVGKGHAEVVVLEGNWARRGVIRGWWTGAACEGWIARVGGPRMLDKQHEQVAQATACGEGWVRRLEEQIRHIALRSSPDTVADQQ